MDYPSSDPPRPSPRRELQGPRPTPLKVSKDSHKIAKRPPVHPAPAAAAAPARPPQPPQPHHRAPVIIYAVSPKVIHTNPADFMTLVQRLTGPDPDAAAAAASDPPLPSPSYAGGPISPAARMATIERATNSPSGNRKGGAAPATELGFMDQFEIVGGSDLDRAAPTPGILSPMPSSLPPISPAFFSPGFDPTFLSFLHELSPAVPSSSNTRGFLDGGGAGGSFSASPNPFLSTPTIPSPGAPFWDILNQFPDI